MGMNGITGAFGSTAFADGTVLAAADDGVGLLTIHSPETRNAITLAMWDGLSQALDQLARDPSVRVVILMGTGVRAFATTAIPDLSDPDGLGARLAAYEARSAIGYRELAAFPKPVIARIRGDCMGSGLGLAMHADLRIAGVDTLFCLPAAQNGTGLGFDVVRRLVALVGQANARMLLFTAARIEGKEAARIGLVNQVVPDEDLSEAVVEIARTMADSAPLSLTAAKLALEQTLRNAADRDLDAVERAVAAAFASPDCRERSVIAAKRRRARYASGS
jgi:enoyl-CoA hydratase